METLIQFQLRLHTYTSPLISFPSTIINKPKLRTKQLQLQLQLHAKRKTSGGAPLLNSVSQLKTKEEEESNAKTTKEDEDEDEDEDEIPEKVFDRMVQRISISVGVPIGSGMTLIYVLDKLSKSNIYDPPPWLPFFILLVSFGSGALAMAYGTLSTSWDPDKHGSFFGFEQIQKNWSVLWKEDLDNKHL